MGFVLPAQGNGESIHCFALLLCEAFLLPTELLYLNTLPILSPSHWVGLTQVKPPQPHRHSTHTFFLLSCHSWKKVTLKYATEQHEGSEIVPHHCTKPRTISRQKGEELSDPLTSEFFGWVVKITCLWLHHTPIIHKAAKK